MKWGLVEMNKSEMNLWTAVLTFHSCHCLTLMRPVHDIHTGLFLCGLVSDSIYHDHDRSLDQNCLDFRCHRADKFSLCSMNDYNVYVDHCSYATNFGAYACTSFTFNKIARISCVVDIENTHTHNVDLRGVVCEGICFRFHFDVMKGERKSISCDQTMFSNFALHQQDLIWFNFYFLVIAHLILHIELSFFLIVLIFASKMN